MLAAGLRHMPASTTRRRRPSILALILKRYEPGETADKGELKVGGKVKLHTQKKAGEHNGKHGSLGVRRGGWSVG